MAERRMFAKTIVLSDAFLDMPMSARCLYFTLGMLADDDGFVNSPKSIMRQCGASEDDLKVLMGKKFIIGFESGVIVIKHWRINNYLRNDRYVETKYVDEKGSLTSDESGIYHFGIPVGIPSDNQRYTQYSIGKDSIGNKGVINNSSSETHSVSDLVSEWNSLSSLGIKPISKLCSGSKRYSNATARLTQYGYDEVTRAIDNIRNSDFLQGKNSRSWVITFDWFVLPSNFPKVLEGNYDNKTEINNEQEAKREWKFG